jgi:L-ascorbate metabolism protein UlaG (beta-lactamase superfamily)
MKLTFLGHSTFLISVGGMQLLLDPFFPQGEPILAEKIDYILLTHGHQDHMAGAEALLQKHGSTLLSTYEVTDFFVRQGYTGIHMNHGGDIDLPFGNVKLVNAVHSSSLPDGSYGGNPAGFVISTDTRCVYFAGDTALTMDMKLIPLMCKPLDLAILPIGNIFTMGYKDARIAADFVECDRVLGCHYDTFPPIKIDQDAAKTYFAEGGKTLHLLTIGDTLDV